MQKFQVVLDRLKEDLGGKRVPALPPAYYAEAHASFESASTQQNLVRDFLVEQTRAQAAVSRRPVRMLSVGCGGGQLDVALMDRLGEDLQSYTGIDTSEAQINSFRRLIGARQNATLIHGDFMSMSAEQEFDVCQAVHVAYYMDDVNKFLDKLISARASGGRIIVGIAPYLVMNMITAVFWTNQGAEPVFSESIQEILTARGEAFELTRIEAAIPLSFYIGETANEHVIDFTIDAKASSLDAVSRAALDEVFLASTVPTPAGPAIPHPVDMIVLK